MPAVTDTLPPTATGPAACTCGTGLSAERCCVLDLRNAATAFPGEQGMAEVTAMHAAMAAQDHVAAKAAAIVVLEQVPGHRDALLLLFNMLGGSGASSAATLVVERLTALHPNDATLRPWAVQHFLALADHRRAEFHARMLLRLAPEAVIAHLLIGRIFLALFNPKAAEHHFSLGLRLPIKRGPPVDPQELENYLAVALRHQGRFDEARTIFRRLAEQARNRLGPLLAWAEMEEAAHDFVSAGALLDRIEAIAPGHPQAVAARATLFRRLKQPERALAVLDAAAGQQDGTDTATLLERGHALDAMGRYDEAFVVFAAAKAQLRDHGGRVYQAEHARQLAGALTGFFTPGRDPLFPRATLRDDHPQPIFIVGFPRSGTTLVEQTLSGHPDIAGGDELPIIESLSRRVQLLLGSPLAYPKALSELWMGDRAGQIETLRDQYLNEAVRLGAVDPAKRWFTDKMPLNETHLGLIHLLFPHSPIIHLVRHPLDVVLSVFSNALTHGFHCASALESAAQHYALIADLIAHYRSALPLRYHAIRYEDLVVDQERQVRAMADFIGVPFAPAMLAFHENRRAARTASYAQVTEKLYDRSRYRYRNYLTRLAPIVPILQPAIDRLGYSVEE